MQNYEYKTMVDKILSGAAFLTHIWYCSILCSS